MKKLLVYAFVIGIPLAAVHYARKYGEDSQFAAKFFVYSQEVENPVQLYLRDIPSRYEKFFKAERIQPFTGDLALYRVNSSMSGDAPDVHYIVEDKEKHSLNFLKSRFLLREKPENVDAAESDSYLIDYRQFSRCVPKRCDTEELVTRFATMIADDLDSRKFRRIRSLADIDSIRFQNQKEFFRCSQSQIADLDFINELGQNEFLFWYFDKGIVKLTANKVDGKVQSITSRRLGFAAMATGMSLTVSHE